MATTRAPAFIDSAQILEDGTPRFRIPTRPDHADWQHAATAETDGGVHADIRVFMDEQLETGDIVLDVAPGFGFVALSAATAPGGVATVFVSGIPDAELVRLQDAASDAGAWIEPLEAHESSALETLIGERLGQEGRLLVHTSAQCVVEWCNKLAHSAHSSRVLAVCVSGDITEAEWPGTKSALDSLGMATCALVEQDGAGLLVPLAGPPLTPVIAVPAGLFGANAETAIPDTTGVEDIFGSPSESSSGFSALPEVAPRWVPTRDGLSFIAPHSRTGYGVAGAHLLSALQRSGVPVALFPLGSVDPTLTNNPLLPSALERQASYNPAAPSVRLSQQFDLALHAGHGPKVALTIFETEEFTARELHHLRQQDLIVTCSHWGANVCRANGLDDKPVLVVPLGVDMSVFNNAVAPARTTHETVFLQVGKLEPRKGQRELLRAFEAAFTASDPVRLVLACHNPFMKSEAFKAATAPFRNSTMSRRITIVGTELATASDVAALMASADCGVFPVRAEGWNLEALEMLAMGKQLIASHATGHTAYLTSENARLIKLGAPEPATAGNLCGTWGSWGAEQHEALVSSLREVHEAKQSGSLAPNVAGIRTATHHSWEASAAALLNAIATVA